MRQEPRHPMSVEIREERTTDLGDYAAVPIAFEVHQILSVVMPERGIGGIQLELRQLAVSRTKDYDALAGNHPTDWASRFDVSGWGVFAAWAGGARVGGATVAWRSPGLDMLEGRADLAVLWDLRVAPESRRRGVGRALFGQAVRWAGARGARWLKIETQNVNVPACRFYAAQGCELGAVHRFAYQSLPDEVQLCWYKQLTET